MNGFILAVSLALIPDGSLLFVQNGNEYVARETGSSYTHVAIILNEDGVPYVYEAAPPKVRKVSLSVYKQEIEKENKRRRKNMKLWVRYPKQEFTARNIESMGEYLHAELGRRYSVGGYLTGKPVRGIHCGELTVQALRYVKIKIVGNPCKQTPISISNSIDDYYSGFLPVD